MTHGPSEEWVRYCPGPGRLVSSHTFVSARDTVGCVLPVKVSTTCPVTGSTVRRDAPREPVREPVRPNVDRPAVRIIVIVRVPPKWTPASRVPPLVPPLVPPRLPPARGIVAPGRGSGVLRP